jgi:hypothetical protein
MRELAKVRKEREEQRAKEVCWLYAVGLGF